MRPRHLLAEPPGSTQALGRDKFTAHPWKKLAPNDGGRWSGQ